jgi:GNAT superfamily N-acetyltransferase
MGQVHLEDTVGRLGTLYVADDRRRRGIGSAVVAALQGWALAAGADVLLCHIPDVSAAAPMAEHLGWHRTDEVFGTRHGLQERRWTLAVDR